MAVSVEPRSAGSTDSGPVDQGRDEPVLLSVDRADRAVEFSAFMMEAWPVLGRTALLLSGDRYRAEELVQHALVKTYVAWNVARVHDPLAYARRVLVNLRIDTWRQLRREVLLAPADLPERESAGPSPMQRREDAEVLVRALRGLPVRRRRIVVLRYLEGLSEREVADLLGLPVGTVKSSSARGLTELRVALGGGQEDNSRMSRQERRPS